MGAGVRYLVAGGRAVHAHGYLRFTRDVDLAVVLTGMVAPKNLGGDYVGRFENLQQSCDRVFESIGLPPILSAPRICPPPKASIVRVSTTTARSW